MGYADPGDARAAARRFYHKNRERLLAKKREQYAQNPEIRERRNRNAKRWRERNPEQHIQKVKEACLRRKYGLTPEEVDTLFEAQHGRCRICTVVLMRGGSEAQSMAIDHCHETGKVRGILCHHCNRGLGFFKDDVARLRNAIHYLKEE